MVELGFQTEEFSKRTKGLAEHPVTREEHVQVHGSTKLRAACAQQFRPAERELGGVGREGVVRFPGRQGWIISL